jgi:nicotinamidase-related amidase
MNTQAVARPIPRLHRDRTGLLVVDIQEKLWPAVFEKERVLQNAVRLAKGAALFGRPVFVTEQYRKGLGPTVAELAAAIPGFAPVEKLAFSAGCVPAVLEALRAARLTGLLVCGLEAHVCVCQTCLDLLEHGFQTFVAADAVSSRTAENWRLGLERVREAGATLVSTEMALFEWLGRAGTDEFRQVLSLVK